MQIAEAGNVNISEFVGTGPDGSVLVPQTIRQTITDDAEVLAT